MIQLLTAHAHSRVDHDNVMLIVIVEVGYQLPHLFERESLRIKGKHPPLVHVVDICPHRLQRDLCLAVVVDHFGEFIDIAVSITALVELKSQHTIRTIESEREKRTPKVQ